MSVLHAQSPDDDPQRTDVRLVFTLYVTVHQGACHSNVYEVYLHDPPLFLSRIERRSSLLKVTASPSLNNEKKVDSNEIDPVAYPCVLQKS